MSTINERRPRTTVSVPQSRMRVGGSNLSPRWSRIYYRPTFPPLIMSDKVRDVAEIPQQFVKEGTLVRSMLACVASC